MNLRTLLRGPAAHLSGGAPIRALAAIVGLLLAVPAAAQTVPPGAPASQQATPPVAAAGSTRTAPPATLVYGNRRITELRASIFGRTPAERVSGAVTVLNGIVAAGSPGPVTAQRIEGVMVVAVGGRPIFAILPADIDELAGETLEQQTAGAVRQLQVAINEEVELRTPARLVKGGVQACLATLVFVGLLWALVRAHRVLAAAILRGTEQKLQRFSAGDLQLVRASRAPDLLRWLITAAAVVLGLIVTYSWVTFVLRRFPYTRPWGESLREALLTRVGAIGVAILNATPNLFTIVLIILITRFVIRLANLLFEAAERERLTLPWVYPETAQPTRRLVTALLWLFALIASYPYLPGSDSDAFKGVSVFVGLIISLGSSGIVNQVMSGLTLTYSRALRLGDFVKIGDVEGTVVHLGSLSTKIKTNRQEEVTIPNAVVVSDITTNYSRYAESDGLLVPTTITIGYDVPWRQVKAMLLLAAERTPGIQRKPAPVVRQTGLRDSYVEYTVLVSPEQPQLRVPVLDALHAHILDVFNEFGVQITSPNYEGDPDAPKVVPREQWYAAPARAPEGVREGV